MINNSFMMQSSLKFWCQTALPAVYDDSLSYYELLAKIVDYCNKNNDNINYLYAAIQNDVYNPLNAINFVSPTMFMNDDSDPNRWDDAMAEAVEECVNNSKTLFIEPGITVKLQDSSYFRGIKNIIALGTIAPENDLVFAYDSNQRGVNWFFAKITGSIELRGVKASNITIMDAETLTLKATTTSYEYIGEVKNYYEGSIAYNKFNLGTVRNVNIISDSVKIDNTDAWINENSFYGGRILNLQMTGAYLHNHNSFYDCVFERYGTGAGANYPTIRFETGVYNRLLNCRFEGINDGTIYFSKKTLGNYVERGYDNTVRSLVSENRLTTWGDESGNNFYSICGLPVYKVYRHEINASNNNFNTDNFIVQADGLHFKAINNVAEVTRVIFESNIIDITETLTVKAVTDCSASFTRWFVKCYDSSMQEISDATADDTIVTALAQTLTWDNTNHCYYTSTSKVGNFNFDVRKIQRGTGTESRVKYIKLICENQAVTTNVSMTYFNVEIYTSSFNPVSISSVN